MIELMCIHIPCHHSLPFREVHECKTITRVGVELCTHTHTLQCSPPKTHVDEGNFDANFLLLRLLPEAGVVVLYLCNVLF